MRKELEPDWETAERLYPQVKGMIEKYTKYCEENGDEDEEKYKRG